MILKENWILLIRKGAKLIKPQVKHNLY